MTYTVEELRERLGEILQEVRTGGQVEIVENGQEIARIRGVPFPAALLWDSIEARLRELEEEGIISRETEPRATLEKVRRELAEEWSVNPPKPGGLARFLESR